MHTRMSQTNRNKIKQRIPRRINNADLMVFAAAIERWPRLTVALVAPYYMCRNGNLEKTASFAVISGRDSES